MPGAIAHDFGDAIRSGANPAGEEPENIEDAKMVMELFEAYPAYTNINGRTFSLRNITKSFKDLDDMCWKYGRMIKFDQRKHEEILELLEYAKEIT